MSTFTKYPNGRIIFDDGKLRSFSPTLNILPHPSDASIALISPYASGQQVTDEALVFDWALVTEPAGAADRDALIQLLSDNYFNDQSFNTMTNDSKTYTIVGKKDSISSSLLDDLTEIPATTVAPEPGGIQLEIVSSSQADNGTSATGVLTVDIHYLDASGLEQEEVITLNGTTPVNTVATDIGFIQWMHSKTVGSGGVAAGNVSLKNTAGTVTYEYITAGGNQSLSGRYKVPVNKIGYIEGWQVSAFTQRVDMRLRATVERFDRALVSGVFLFQDAVALKDTGSGWRPFNRPLVVPALGVIKMSGKSAAAGGDGSGSFDVRIENIV